MCNEISQFSLVANKPNNYVHYHHSIVWCDLLKSETKTIAIDLFNHYV